MKNVRASLTRGSLAAEFDPSTTTRGEVLKHERSEPAAEKPDQVSYEPPQIRDYGTLTELTASKGPRQADFFGGRDGGGGGYS
jgi:hypothetical protein